MESNNKCHKCGKDDTKLLICSQCNNVKYCSQECQKLDWKQV